jgi:electron transfer flavoprotein alpha subunit
VSIPTSPPTVWTLIWHRAGRVTDASLELLGEARRVAGLLGIETEAVVLGDVDDAALVDVAEHGADRVLIVASPQLVRPATKPATAALAQLIERRAPRLVLIPETADGRDIGPRLAARTGHGLVADCAFLRVDPDGAVIATRPAWDGMVSQRVRVGTSSLVMIAPGVFPPRPRGNAKPPVVERIVLDGLPKSDTELLAAKRLEPDDLELDEAGTVVAGGLGMGGEAGFRSLEKLAAVLGAKVGASRRATDLGWVDRSALVGQTGTTVRPSLYFACGISGASQHVLGMHESQVVVAINSDPNAPIFGIADVGIVGDVAEVVPALTDAFERALGGVES